MLVRMPEPFHDEEVDLSVNLAGLTLRNPIATASGTSGYGPEYAPFLDIRSLGAFVTKAVTPEERKGNPQPRTVETASGMLNAIGLANVGLERFCREKIPYLKELGIPVIVNVAGRTPDDFAAVCERLDEFDCISALELNVSCPNVADGLDYGTDPAKLEKLVGHVRGHVHRARLMVKLSPNVTDITATARAAINGGADILSLINTLQGMVINVNTRRPMLANRVGGLSGPAIKPVALAMVYRVYDKVARDAGVPIVGMGGIANWRDVVEFLLAGATAVAIGTMMFIDPSIPRQICDGLRNYLCENKLKAVSSLIGQLR